VPLFILLSVAGTIAGIFRSFFGKTKFKLDIEGFGNTK
jgi:hypothetical protein